jgi:PRTRC genetic system protein A
VNDGQEEMPQDDVFYIVAKEGVFLKKKLGIMESIAPVDNISILDSVSTMAKLHIRRISGKNFGKVINFFKAVYKEHRSESIVLLFYDEAKKRYKIFPPRQKVTAASLDYNRGITVDGMTMIGTIHSHGSMSAFHSGTDDDDEKSFDGLHITIGDVDDEEVSISASIIANGYRFMVEPSEYITNLNLVKDVDKTETGFGTKVYRMVNGKLVLDKKESSKSSYTWRKFDKRYMVNVPEEQQRFNKKWLDVVEKGSYVYHYPGYAGGYGMYGESGWGRHYDPTAWQKYRKVGQKVAGHLNPPGQKTVIIGKDGKVDDSKKQKCLFPLDEIDLQDDDFNPCEGCLYRDYKVMWAIEQYTDEVDDIDEEDLISNFVPAEEYDNIFNGNVGEDHEQIGGALIPNVSDGKPYVCPYCNNKFFLMGHEACPFCYEAITYTVVEKEEVKQEKDGSFLTENDEFYKETLKQAQGNQRIPDPEKSEIPIQTKTLKIKEMFQKVFSKER